MGCGPRPCLEKLAHGPGKLASLVESRRREGEAKTAAIEAEKRQTKLPQGRPFTTSDQARMRGILGEMEMLLPVTVTATGLLDQIFRG